MYLRFGIVLVLDIVLCVSCFYRSCLLLFYDFYINDKNMEQILIYNILLTNLWLEHMYLTKPQAPEAI